MKVTKDLSSDRFNTGTTRMAPLFRSAQMVLRGTFVYGALVNDGTPIGVYATSLRPYDLKSQKNIIDTGSDLLYLDKTLESMDSILKTVSKGDKRFEQTKIIGDKECYVFKPEGFNVTVGEQLADLVNLYTTDEILETLNECYPEQRLIKNAFKVDIHFSSNWIEEVTSNSYYKSLDCRVLSEGGFFLESADNSVYGNRVQRPSSLDEYIDGSIGKEYALLLYRGEKVLNDVLEDRYSRCVITKTVDVVLDTFVCMGVRKYFSLAEYSGLFKRNFESKKVVLTEIVPYISALRLYRDKEAFINHCFGIIERVYTSQCDSETIRFAKEIIATMVERDNTVGGLGCSTIMREIKGEETFEAINLIPVPSE